MSAGESDARRIARRLRGETVATIRELRELARRAAATGWPFRREQGITARADLIVRMDELDLFEFITGDGIADAGLVLRACDAWAEQNRERRVYRRPLDADDPRATSHGRKLALTGQRLPLPVAP